MFAPKHVLKSTRINGGATIDLTGAPVSRSHGYFVAGMPEGVATLDKGDTQAALDMLNFYFDLISTPEYESSYGKFLGTWIDGDDLYIELSEYVPNKEIAMNLARERGELAIFDIANGESIYL